jgi:hypothetical protein
MNKKPAIYQAENGAIELKIDSNQETIWANLKDITELFDTDKSGISRHIKNIFKDCELDRKFNCCIFCKKCNKKASREVKSYQVDIL